MAHPRWARAGASGSATLWPDCALHIVWGRGSEAGLGEVYGVYLRCELWELVLLRRSGARSGGENGSITGKGSYKKGGIEGVIEAVGKEREKE